MPKIEIHWTPQTNWPASKKQRWKPRLHSLREQRRERPAARGHSKAILSACQTERLVGSLGPLLTTTGESTKPLPATLLPVVAPPSSPPRKPAIRQERKAPWSSGVEHVDIYWYSNICSDTERRVPYLHPNTSMPCFFLAEKYQDEVKE